MIPRVVLLLLLLFVLVDGKCTWHFSGALRCPLDCFHYHVEVYEEDWLRKSDDLLTNQTMIESRPPHKYQVEATDTDDGLDVLKKFEIYMLIIHNCTDKGNMKTVKYDWGKFNIDERKVIKTQDFNLYNQGDDV